MKERITKALQRWIRANNALRKHPLAYSYRRESNTEFDELSKEYQESYKELWSATDVEYAEDGFRNIVWEWRYWKVMARKCCWYQLSTGNTRLAGETMTALQNAETKLVEVCGLTDEYKPTSDYIEKQFPNLKND